jgi:thioredoxin 1
MSQATKVPNAAIKALIVIGLVVVVGVALYAKRAAKNDGQAKREGATGQVAAVEKGKAASPESAKAVEPASAQPGGTLPKLVDLGAGKCIPCKMMAPILEELKGEYKGRFDVVFIDVWENPKAGDPYGIKLIPTQIFLDAKGKELFRHEGFFSKEDILAKWKEFGVSLNSTSADAAKE